MDAPEPRLSFGGAAELYERGRPGYPDEAVAWLLGDADRVVELGAGTGKLTETVAAHGPTLLATDPDERMLHYLQQRVPGVPTAVAVAEQIPAADASVDALVAAQAFHWFDLPRAVPEMARVLADGGVLALVWNDRDTGVPWVRRLGDVIGTHDQQDDPVVGLEPFDEVLEVEQQTFRHWQDHDRESLVAMVASRSNILGMGEEERADRLTRVSALYDDYGRGPDGMRLPYVTRCYRIRLRRPEVVPVPVRHEDEPEEWGEPTQAIDRAELPLGGRRPDEDDGTTLIDFR